VDPIGACVGVRGSRIRNIIDELNGEKVDVLEYEEQPEQMIAKALKPAQINSITLNWDTNTADVLVDEDQLSLAIGRRGANVRLASRLAGWEINIQGEGGTPPPAEGAEDEVPAAGDADGAEGGIGEDLPGAAAGGEEAEAPAPAADVAPHVAGATGASAGAADDDTDAAERPKADSASPSSEG
jgi:hypothetical protein